MWSEDKFYNEVLQFLTDLCVISFITLIGLGSIHLISVETILKCVLCIFILFIIICFYDIFEKYIFFKNTK